MNEHTNAPRSRTTHTYANPFVPEDVPANASNFAHVASALPSSGTLGRVLRIDGSPSLWPRTAG